MTFEDYKALVKEYYATDSISRREEIENKLFSALVALIKQLQCLYATYDVKFIADSDWRRDRGGYEIMELDDDTAYLNYSDHWAYGGSCDIGITVPAKFFDVAERKKKEEELKAHYIMQLKNRLPNIDARIESLNKEKENILAKLATFENQKAEEGKEDEQNE